MASSRNRLMLLLASCLCCILLRANVSLADAVLPWSTTYSCPDWNKYSDPLTCDGLSKNGAGTCGPEGYSEQITALANYPGGGGAKGQRHWLGDGVNNNSGGTRITFGAESEIWIRWYMRFQPGFKWSSYQGFKMLYFGDTSGGLPVYYMISFDSDELAMYPQIAGTLQSPGPYLVGNHYVCKSCGWLTLFPTGQSDGSWHEQEVHLKIETAAGNDGIFEAWLDGKQVIDAHTVNYGMLTKGLLFRQFTIGSNSKVPSNGGCYYVDYDDMTVSNKGYIGPLPGTGFIAAPTHLRVVP